MKTHVLMCQERFAPLIREGRKNQTVRPTRKRKIMPGDKLSIRRWTGKPYRSKQQVVIETTVTRVSDIEFGFDCLLIDHCPQLRIKRELFARDDGFKDFDHMLCWFAETHGSMNFKGIAIYWE